MEASFPPSFSVKENVFGTILQKAQFGFALVNSSYIIEYTNQTWLEILGLNKKTAVGKKIFDFFPEAADQLTAFFEETKETREPASAADFKLRIKRSGSVQPAYFSFMYQPVYEDNGAFLYYAVVILEISALVTIKNKIREDEERLRLATESSQTATWDLNLKTREIVHSPLLAEIFGYEAGENISHEQFRSHLFEYDRINIVDVAYKKALKTGIYKYEAHITDRNGVQKWISTNGKIFSDDNELPDRMLGILQDITERKKNEIRQHQSHHQLNTAMEATKLGLFDMNPETLEKYNFSPRFLEIFGYDPSSETIDTHIFEKHIHKDFIDVRAQALQKAQETGDLHYQTKIVLRDGSVKWIELYGRLLRESAASNAYISGTVRDITDLKNYEQKLSASEKKYRFLADVMPQIVWTGEPDGSLTYFNQSTLNYSGKSYKELLEGDGLNQMVHPEEQEETGKRWAASVRTKKPFFFEHRFRDSNNEYRWFMSKAFPEMDDAGNVTKWVGTSTDIDDMKRQEQQKDDFIKMASHELKTPVTTIKGYVQLLKRTRKDSDDKFLVNSLNTIENQVNNLSVLIGDLLDISRMENGYLLLNKHKFSLVELVTESIEDIKASEQSHEINFEMKHFADIEVFADKERLKQVLTNLLTNAIKYSPKANSVNVELWVEDGQGIVSVEDFGIGMEASELGKIFERFYRVSGDDEKTFPGFGIGLYIVKDIIQRLDGKIWVESEKNQGSKFYFSLPVSNKTI